jgi:alpha-ribazole phosphatase/probable phosphoglycerate mutase
MAESKATLVFVRHGCTIDDGENRRFRLNGWTNCPLSSIGVEQAGRVAARLGGEGPFTCVYSSPLQRALQTAQPIVKATRAPHVIYDGLREIHCGALEGLEVTEARRRFPRVWDANLEQVDPDFRWPGGESYREFRARCLATIATIAKHHPGQRVIVVTHAGVVSQLMGYLLGASAARWEPYRPRNATISEIEWREGGGRVVKFDDEHHLRTPRSDRWRSPAERVSST